MSRHKELCVSGDKSVSIRDLGTTLSYVISLMFRHILPLKKELSVPDVQEVGRAAACLDVVMKSKLLELIYNPSLNLPCGCKTK
jgi:hypothetical protein